MSDRSLRGPGRGAVLILAGIFASTGCSAWTDGPLAGLLSSPGSDGEPAAEGGRSSVAEPSARPATALEGSGVDGSSAASDSAPARPADTEPPAPSPSASPRSTVRVIKLKPRPKAGPFRMNLYRRGDFVHQGTKDWCVAGSTATMMNIMDKGSPNGSIASQERLYLAGRRLSPNLRKLGPIGVDLKGWAALLNKRGYGPYVVDGAVTRHNAIRKAALALRLTGRPVGLVTWRGAHSWVMSGFTATADPAFSKDFEVRAVYIEDTWYPYVSTIWGASRAPNTLVPVATLAEDYLPYRRPRARYPDRDGKFMLILPVLPRHTVAR